MMMKAQSYNTDEIEQFYTANTPVLPPYSNWRQFRIFTPDNKVIKFTTTNAKSLQSACLRHKATAVYYTISTFLNPHYLSSKPSNTRKHQLPQWKWLSNTILWSDISIDIDTKNKSNLSNTIQLLKHEFNSSPIKILETGRGYQLHIYHPNTSNTPIPANPFLREQFYINQKQSLANTLKSNNIDFDYPSSTDTRRIMRVQNTLYTKSNTYTPIKELPLTQ